MILPGLLDIIDIFLVAVLLYVTYHLMKRFGALNIFYGVIAVLFIWVMVSYVFKLKLFGGILDKVVNVGVIALIVLFQNEIFFLNKQKTDTSDVKVSVLTFKDF